MVFFQDFSIRYPIKKKNQAEVDAWATLSYYTMTPWTGTNAWTNELVEMMKDGKNGPLLTRKNGTSVTFLREKKFWANWECFTEFSPWHKSRWGPRREMHPGRDSVLFRLWDWIPKTPPTFSNRSVPDWAMFSGEKMGRFGCFWDIPESQINGVLVKVVVVYNLPAKNVCIFLRFGKKWESELSFLNFETDKKCKNKMVCAPLLRNWSKQVWIWVEETY